MRTSAAIVSGLSILLATACAATTAPPPKAADPAPEKVSAKTDAPTPASTTASTTGSTSSRVPPMSVAFDSNACSKVQGSEQTVALFKKGCQGGDAAGCHELSIRYLCGVGVVRDLQEAVNSSLRACDLGSIHSCANGGGLLLQLHGSPDDMKRGMEALDKGCNGGDVAACNNLATVYMTGIGRPAEPERAVALFDKLCQAGNAMSCANLAQMLGAGIGTARDPERARKLATKACAEDIAVGCNVVGALMMESSPPDDLNAVKMFDRSCTLGAPAACDNLAQCYVMGRGVTVDMNKAASLFTKACNAGHAHACTALGQIQPAIDALGTANTSHSF